MHEQRAADLSKTAALPSGSAIPAQKVAAHLTRSLLLTAAVNGQPGSLVSGSGAVGTVELSDGEVSKSNMSSSVLATASRAAICWLFKKRFSINARSDV